MELSARATNLFQQFQDRGQGNRHTCSGKYCVFLPEHVCCFSEVGYMSKDEAVQGEIFKSEAAKALSELGAAKGGKARAKALSREERSRIAREAVETRWRNAG